jgi:hypothetical protein
MSFSRIDFKEFLQLLITHEVEYLLVGGIAVGYHGYPRATVDLDIWVSRKPRNAAKLEAISKMQITFKDKARADEKAQHTWEYVSILRRSATPYLGVRCIFEIASRICAKGFWF